MRPPSERKGGRHHETTKDDVLIREIDDVNPEKNAVAIGELLWQFDGEHVVVTFQFSEWFGMDCDEVWAYVRDGLPFDTESLCWVGITPSGLAFFNMHADPLHFKDVAHAVQRAVIRSLVTRMADATTNKKIN